MPLRSSFQFGIDRESGMPQLTNLLEKLRVQVGPTLKSSYPLGHQHAQARIGVKTRSRRHEGFASGSQCDPPGSR
jgi:hypothetical protein